MQGTTACRHMFAEHNKIHHFSQFKRTYQPGIYWGGVQNVYSWNNVTDGPHNCFLGGGNEQDGVDCLFEHNILDTCAFEVSLPDLAYYCCGHSCGT